MTVILVCVINSGARPAIGLARDDVGRARDDAGAGEAASESGGVPHASVRRTTEATASATASQVGESAVGSNRLAHRRRDGDRVAGVGADEALALSVVAPSAKDGHA
jgi:hypothetical protein